MLLKLNKNSFARKRLRERENSNIFNKTSSGITDIMPFIIPLFFAPVLITTSLFSKEIILILANTTLGLGYMSNYLYRIYNKEVSKSELIISALLLAGLLTLSYFLYPTMIAISFMSVLGLVNQMAAAVNLFFLIKNAVVPPLKRIIEKIALYFGVDISAGYFNKAPMTLDKDRFVLDRLLVQAHGHDSFSPQFNKKQLRIFNNLLRKLCSYINKYDESFFGYFLNKNAISEIESQINSIVTQGNADSSYTFIKKKMGFKVTKIKLLKAAEEQLLNLIHDPTSDAASVLPFFSNANETDLKSQRKELLSAGICCLRKEIKRQETKLNSLKACIPSPQRMQ